MELFAGVGANGDNFTGAILDDQATTPIANGSAPFTGAYAPQNGLALAPGNANSWNNLGVAYYSAGDWQKAIEALRKADQMLEGADRYHWFFLAMAHWRLGNKEEARRYYDEAVEWMDDNKPDREELHRFRAEAAELLATSETPPQGKEKTDETTTEGSGSKAEDSRTTESDRKQPSTDDP